MREEKEEDGILMRAQHVIALSGPLLVIVCEITMQPGEQQALLSPPDRNSFGTETDPKPTGESAPLLALHTKSPNSLIYARKKVRDLNGKGVALVRVLVVSDEKSCNFAILIMFK